MADPSTHHAQTFWKHGHWMSRAYIAFADEDQKSECEVLQNISAMDAFKASAAKLNDSDMPMSDHFLNALAAPQEIVAKRQALNAQLRQQLLRWIEADQIIGYGFEPPRNMASKPIEIPKRMWSGQLNWDASTIKAGPLQCSEIRLIHHATRKRLLGIVPQPNPETKQAGRPTIKADVEATFAALNRQGRIDTGNSAKAHYDLVREYMQATAPDRYPASRTISNEGIRAYFNPLFKGLKENKKQ